MNKYGVFVIDPPWPQRKGGKRSVRPRQGRELDYQTLGINEIFEILDEDIFTAAEEQHVVFLWCIDRILPNAEKEMADRGYKLHARLIWDKGNGVAPAFTIRYSHEYLLWFYKPPLLPISKEMRGVPKTVFAERGRQHSRKPDVAYSIISALYPEVAKLDVFSREKRDDYKQWGDECRHFTESKEGTVS